MPTKTDWVQYDDQRGYLAWPERATAPLPAVLVIQEVWGVDAHIQDVTRRLASAGYAAFAPDLYEVNGQSEPATSPAIEVQGLIRRFDELTAVDNVSFITRASVRLRHGAAYVGLRIAASWCPDASLSSRARRAG